MSILPGYPSIWYVGLICYISYASISKYFKIND